MRVKLDDIIIDTEIDVRAGQDDDAIGRYAESIGALPPITVFDTPDGMLLAGGFHRVAAHRRAGHDEVDADLRKGTRADAMEFAVLDNLTHGVPLSKTERDGAIRRLKELGWKQDDIAARSGVSKSRVSHILRDELRSATFCPPECLEKTGLIVMEVLRDLEGRLPAAATLSEFSEIERTAEEAEGITAQISQEAKRALVALAALTHEEG